MLERIDPAREQGQLILDHYARYAFAGQLVPGRRVLDVACGTGYGSHLLRRAGASAVVGVDISEEAVGYARTHYADPGVEFLRGDAQAVSQLVTGPFGAVVSFETIEHITEPTRFVRECRALLADDGLLICSVPNDVLLKPNNPYHVHEFGREEFVHLLGEFFPNVVVCVQYCAVTSVIEVPERDAMGALEVEQGNLGFLGQEERHPDAFVAVCGRREPAEPLRAWAVQARRFREYYQGLEKRVADVDRLSRAWEEQRLHIQELERVRDDIWGEAQRLAAAWEEQRARIGEVERAREELTAELGEARALVGRLEWERRQWAWRKLGRWVAGLVRG